MTLRLIHALGAAALLVTLLGCSSLRHGWTLRQYQGQVLRVKHGGAGAERLAIESAFDVSIRHFVEQNGEPDYIYTADGRTVQLIYIDDDRVVLFQRSIWNPVSQATVTEGIPDGLAPLFTRVDQERLAQKRTRRRSSVAPAGTPP